MGPKPILTYFQAHGAAEAARFIFAYGGIDYEDVRLSADEWKVVKPDFPFGQLPCLEVDGHKINQHKAIARYAARQAKLAGTNDLENAIIDAVVDTINDLKLKHYQPYYEQDQERKEAILEKLRTEIVPNYVEKLEAILDKNNGYFALGRLTWADFYFASADNTWVHWIPDFYDKAPKLKALVDRVNELPAIKNWLSIRPKHEH